ncbi:helix-turn-helix domain-containing protein [Paenibacillus sp. IHBB 10380]|uniref:helix-turn-helix domain-containing protein n=1 Tax=Paenibacillus sp. IHBB 10380 TaxID=1566358 RepID=UPI0005CFA192|nr:helix-turn-helix transcriptional regulator [Paenibacillus sp. IHBB 10380]AJS58381.1 DNA-binding protein [Paenibacillus sp. IHBB 10380]
MKQTTIRAELEDYLKRKGTTINQFAVMAGVNSGTISNIINGNRPIAMQQLDRITDGMGLPQGNFYDLYVDECFIHSNPNWRRIRPFLYRCTELNKLECIRRVAGMMMENLSYSTVLFDTAEAFFKQGKNAAAVLLYESVAESEKYQHSERLALCQYRLFTLALGDDQDANLRASVQFEGYVDRLDEVDQLDALKALANIYISLRRWEKVDRYAKGMGRKATIQYTNRYGQVKKDKFQKEPAMPLFSYILYSHVLCSSVCDERGDYVQALHYVSLYSEMSWVKEDTQEAQKLMKQCKGWAKANTYLYRLLMGDIEVLPEYVTYIEQQEEEILPALFKIIQAANRYQFNVDDVLLRFEKGISSYRDLEGEVGTYNRQVIADRYAHFMAEVASYYFSRKKYDMGTSCILESLLSSVKIYSESCVIRCVGLFEQFRHAISLEAQKEYQNLISEVRKHYEKKNGFVIGNV